jgi:hypothetical protein
MVVSTSTTNAMDQQKEKKSRFDIPLPLFPVANFSYLISVALDHGSVNHRCGLVRKLILAAYFF